MKHITALLVPICILVVAVLAVTSTPAAAAPPYPSYGTAVVDGNSSEWNLTNDYFATFCNTAPCNEPAPGGPQPRWAQVQGAKLYLRYSCDTHLLYVLVPGTGTIRHRHRQR